MVSRASLLCKDSGAAAPMRTVLQLLSGIDWIGSHAQQCLEGKSFPRTESSPSAQLHPVYLQQMPCTAAPGLTVLCVTGHPPGLIESSVTGVAVAAQAKPHSFASATLGQCVWGVNAEVTDSGLASQTLEQGGSQQCKDMGDRNDHRHDIQRGLWYMGRAVTSGGALEMVSFQRHRAVGKLKGESNAQKVRGSD